MLWLARWVIEARRGRVAARRRWQAKAYPTFCYDLAMLRKLVGGALAIVMGLAQSQTKTTLQPKFEVASVKRSNGCQDGGGRGGDGGGGGSWSPGRLSLECRSLMNLVQIAYVEFADGKRRSPDRGVPIEGGPSWINSDRYDIDAKADDAPGREMMSGPMMQALLEDRFKLKMRREIR